MAKILVLYDTQSGNTRAMAEAVAEYDKHYAYPKVILGSNEDFFSYIESNFAGDIPTSS